jgi:hypothetical protein
MAVLTTALTRLRADFNTIAPNRDKGSDGWIGDEAHKQRRSGHNPDESGGGEYEDADTKDEVRAIDVDKDFRTPGLTMQMCINKILATPNDLKRLKYIIFNRVIWSAGDGWRPRYYDGSNPHDHHGHFSGHPSWDEDARPWSILQLKEDNMALDQADKDWIDGRLHRLAAFLAAGKTNDLMNPDTQRWMTESGTTTMDELAAQVANLETNDVQLSDTDRNTIADMVADKLFAKVVENQPGNQ